MLTGEAPERTLRDCGWITSVEKEGEENVVFSVLGIGSPDGSRTRNLHLERVTS